MAQTKQFGYGRVSSADQNEARQIDALLKAGVHERDIYIDKQSGKNFDRPQYQLMKHQLREGDTLFIHSLDRLGRDKEMILDEWKQLTKEVGADVVVLDMELLDTRKYRDSLGQFVSDLVLQILSWVAEEERVKIKTRQREGIEAAKKRGVHLGRPTIDIDDEFIDTYNTWKQGDLTAVQAFTKLGIGKTTFYKKVKEYEANEGK